VVRFRIWLATALAVGAIITGLLRAQVSEEQQNRSDKSDTNESHAASSPKPKKTPSPSAKRATGKSAKKGKKSDETEERTPSATPRETPEPTTSPKSKRRHTPTPKPKAAKKKSQEKETAKKTKKTDKSESARKEEETPKPGKTPAHPAEAESAAALEASPPPPHAVAAATPTPTPQSKSLRAVPGSDRSQIVIEKSGVEEDQGYEPPPSPPPRRFGFWPWSRSSTNYRYLTRSVIEAIRRAPVKRRRWQFIVVHNSGTRQGNARVFDYYHRHVRRMQNGLAYHFVIGNGTSTGNGEIEVGDRWRRQINGGHVHSDYLNNISLGICLVGDFNRDQPTRAQLESCEELIRYLRERCGKVDKGEIPVRPHREMNPPRWATDCPGDAFPYSWFRRF
jgi:N-acetylmuramoyl-L-alanine amidase